jgi:hypothetical protein
VKFRATKFSQSGQACVYKEGASSFFDDPFQTSTQRTTQNVSSKDYVVPNKKGIMANRGAHALPSRKFMARSTYMDTYVNYDGLIVAVDSLSTEAASSTFNSYSNGGTHISIDQLNHFIHSVFPDRTHEMLVSQTLATMEGTGKVAFTLNDFTDAIASVRSVLYSQCRSQLGGHYVPAWMTSTKGPSVVSRDPIASTAQLDMGMYGENPRERGLYARKSAIQGTTKDLFRGTTKASVHIPGYKGFISNAKEPSLSTNQLERPSSATLRMNYKPSVPGYTGHYQRESENVSLPKASKLTSAGASQMFVKKTWSRRGVNLD